MVAAGSLHQTNCPCFRVGRDLLRTAAGGQVVTWYAVSTSNRRHSVANSNAFTSLGEDMGEAEICSWLVSHELSIGAPNNWAS